MEQQLKILDGILYFKVGASGLLRFLQHQLGVKGLTFLQHQENFLLPLNIKIWQNEIVISIYITISIYLHSYIYIYFVISIHLFIIFSIYIKYFLYSSFL